MRILLTCATINGRDRVGNSLSIATLGGVAVVSVTIFEIIVSLCCSTLGGVTLDLVTILVIAGITRANGWDGFTAYTLGSGDVSEVMLHCLILC